MDAMVLIIVAALLTSQEAGTVGTQPVLDELMKDEVELAPVSEPEPKKPSAPPVKSKEKKPKPPMEERGLKKPAKATEKNKPKAKSKARYFSVISKRIPFKDRGPKMEPDYLVDMGSRAGVKDGDLLDVFRRVPVRENSAKSKPRNLFVRVARLKAIQVQDELSVTRIVESFAQDATTPNVDIRYIMVGDIVVPADKRP